MSCFNRIRTLMQCHWHEMTLKSHWNLKLTQMHDNFDTKTQKFFMWQEHISKFECFCILRFIEQSKWSIITSFLILSYAYNNTMKYLDSNTYFKLFTDKVSLKLFYYNYTWWKTNKEITNYLWMILEVNGIFW